jgi:hypothetical protein
VGNIDWIELAQDRDRRWAGLCSMDLVYLKVYFLCVVLQFRMHKHC